jgi:hypothetical protein
MATTPTPQNNSTDPQVPGNYPGTVQNPTQLPAPVNPASDPEVPPLPNDVDPNFIPNPAPVNNTIDPEVPQPEENFPRKKRFDAEPVSPAANPEVPQPTVEQNLFVDAPAPVSSAANPEVPQPQSVQNYFTDATPAPVENYFTDETPIVQNYFTDRTPAPVENYFTDETPIVQNYFTDATPVSPAANPQVPEAPIVQNYFVDEPPIVQNYFTDETPIVQNFFTDDIPVNPAVNPQVPNIFSSIGALLSSLFGIRPTPVSPAANPQVAQAFPVRAPVVFTPTPIPPAANPQIPATPIVQNYFTDRTPAPVVPAANPQVPETPIVQNYFTDATPAPVENYFTDATPTPIVQNYFTDATPVIPAANPQVPEPPIVQNYFVDEPPIVQNYFTDAVPAPIQNYFTDATPVSPVINPEVPQPTQEFSGRKKADPDIVDSPTEPAVQAQAATRIDGPVNQALLQQSNPAAATDYRSYVVDTQNKIVEQQTRELEATQGYPASENQIAVINGEAFGTATIAANVRFKNQVESADAAQSVPANTPPPTIVPADVNVPALPNDVDPNFITNTAPVDNTIEPQAAQVDEALVAARAIDPNFIPLNDVSATTNPQVPSSANTRVENVNQSEFAQKDPTVAQQYNDFKNETAAQLTTQRIAEREAVEGGPISVSEQVQIAARAEIDATADANFRYQDQIEAAGAGTVVPADTPPPTVTAPAVSTESNPQVVVPPTRIESVSTETLLQNDPTTAQEYTAFKTETAAQLTTQRIAEREAVEGGEISVSEQAQIAARANIDATADANFRYQDQIQAAGAGTTVPADTPPPTVEAPTVDSTVDQQTPQPDDNVGEFQAIPAAPPVQSPSPFERFLAEENAATDAAQAAATARFNAQFDDGGNIIGSADDPQVNQGDVTDVGEFQAEPPPIPDIDTGYEDFYGIDEVNNVGEFQAEPVADGNSGYDEFYGDDTGEFQDLSLEPAAGDGESAGYDEFYGDDTGEFQDLSLEPDAVGSDDTGFSDFSDTGGGDGGDFFGGLFGSVKRSAGAVSGGSDPIAGIFDGLFGSDSTPTVNPKTRLSPAQLAANKQKAAKALAKQQNIINQQRKQANDGDWRVRLRLAGSADYLYNAPSPGILAPLSKSGSDGVIFPYTPQITTAYQAKYNAYELTHSNYKGYFYQGSSVGDISINATFTAQDTQEANYLLAVIHFFRSVTKMFYGQDDSAQRGAPPPLVFLQGLGEYQFNRHPCVVTNFNYTLPADVDYIRALSPNNDGTNLSNRRSLQSGVTPFINPSSSRLQNAGLPQGGLYTPPAPPTLGTNSPTYVPTKMDIQITLLAIQTRSQVSKQFSLKNFANGNLIKGGFW